MTIKLSALYNIFGQHPEGRWIIKAANAKLLYDFVKKNKIKNVLDLGTGIGTSAAIVALALSDKGENYQIDTVEQFEKCIKIAKQLIPEELQKNMNFHKSEVEVWKTDMIPYQHFSNYKTLPEPKEWDLIINDGPAPFLEGSHLLDLPNGTIIKMLIENKLKPGAFIVYDGRLHMLNILEKYFSDNFYLVRPAQIGDNLNILERKDNPLCFKDLLLESMKTTSYFNENSVPGIKPSSSGKATASPQ